MCFCVDPDNGRAVKDTNINTLFGEPRCGGTGTEPKKYFYSWRPDFKSRLYPKDVINPQSYCLIQSKHITGPEHKKDKQTNKH